jgi:hypothetical protein
MDEEVGLAARQWVSGALDLTGTDPLEDALSLAPLPPLAPRLWVLEFMSDQASVIYID